MKLVLSTLMVVVMLVAIVHAQPQVKDEVAKRQQQFLPPKALFMDYEEVEDEDEVAKRQQQFLPPKGQGQKMFYDVQDEEAKRQQQFLPPIPTLLSEKRGKAEVGLGMSDENQRRGINNGSLASRLLADILQYENLIRNPGAEKVERVLNKRSHGLLDNLLRPPPPPAGVSLSERLAEDLLDSLETVTSTRVRRDQEEMAEDDEERETSLDLNSRGISAQEMSPPQLIVKDEEAKRQQQPILDLLKNKFNLLKNKLKNKLDQVKAKAKVAKEKVGLGKDMLKNKNVYSA